MLARVVFYIFVYAALLAGAAVLLWQTVQWIRRKAKGPGIKIGPRPKKGLGVWTQVYDTESMEDAKKIQRKFLDAEIPCLVYQQGKKDVYGDRMKHYGISVPREVMEKAQNLLAKIAL